MNRGLALYRSGQLVEAEAVFRPLTESAPTNATAVHLLGVVLHGLGRHDEALVCLRRSLDLEPKNAGFWNNLGGVQRKIGLLTDAATSFDCAIARQPTLAEAHYNRGLTLRTLGRDTAARDSFHMALVQQPRYPDAHFQLGLLATADKDEAIAQTCFRSALTHQPNHRNARVGLTESLLRQARFPDALPLAIALADEVAATQAHWQNIAGSMHSKLGQKPQALARFRRAVELDDRSADAWTNVGITLGELGDPDGAREAIDRALAIEPQHALATFFRDSLAGITPAAAPRDFVSGLFDDYADRFDQHLTERLHYQTPRLLAEMVVAHVPSPIGRLLDLGCGTGLSGAAFASLTDEMIGVDLSQQMLRHAANRKLYRELIHNDIIEQTATYRRAFDLIVAADVFVYVGDLHSMFIAALNALVAGGHFAFSVERLTVAGEYQLLPSRRYAHTESYLRNLAARSGFEWIEVIPSVLRQEQSRAIQGLLVLLRRKEIGPP